ncbi:MAG: hypothetical protein IPM16_10775 [Chloroflexi bacterium]|nr:hypothetical protein [Chloroflexota bacterium]
MSVTLAKRGPTAHQVYSLEYPVTDYFAIEDGAECRGWGVVVPNCDDMVTTFIVRTSDAQATANGVCW